MKSEETRYRGRYGRSHCKATRRKIVSFSDECGKWLACDACNEEAVAQLSAGANAHVLIDHPGKLGTYVNELPSDTACDLMEMSEKPLDYLSVRHTQNLANAISGKQTETGFAEWQPTSLPLTFAPAFASHCFYVLFPT